MPGNSIYYVKFLVGPCQSYNSPNIEFKVTKWIELRA